MDGDIAVHDALRLAIDPPEGMFVEALRELARRPPKTRLPPTQEHLPHERFRTRHGRYGTGWQGRQEGPRRAAAAVWKRRELEQRPRVRDAATSGQIRLEQAVAVNETLNGLPTCLDKAQHQHAEDLILVAATHLPVEKLRTMAESFVETAAPAQAETSEQCVPFWRRGMRERRRGAA